MGNAGVVPLALPSARKSCGILPIVQIALDRAVGDVAQTLENKGDLSSSTSSRVCSTVLGGLYTVVETDQVIAAVYAALALIILK